MATIQIRDLPEETYETIRCRARRAGKSIQSYMRDQVIQLASGRSKEEALAALEAVLEREATASATDSSAARRIVGDVRAERP